MSSYYRDTLHPETGRLKNAHWLYCHFFINGLYHYGVDFGDGKIYTAIEVKAANPNIIIGPRTS